MFLICTRDDVFLIVFFAQKILLNSKIHQRTFGLISPRPNHPFTLSFRRPLIWTGLAVFLAQAETRGKLMVGWKRGEFCSDLFRSAQVVFQKICAESLWDIFFEKSHDETFIPTESLVIFENMQVMRYHDGKNNTKNLYPYDLWVFFLVQVWRTCSFVGLTREVPLARTESPKLGR